VCCGVLHELAKTNGLNARGKCAPSGPEFIAQAVADWCRFNGADTVFIDPGSPWQNAWTESFNGRMRDEPLNGQQFEALLEANPLMKLRVKGEQSG